jgi:hypothetical protein
VPKGRNTMMDVDDLISWADAPIPSNYSDFIPDELPRTKNWTDDILLYGRNESTCIKILFEKSQLLEVSCRLDVSKLSKELLEHLISFIQAINADIFCEDKIYEADYMQLIELIKNSDAFRFCKDPHGFLETLRQKNIQK